MDSDPLERLADEMIDDVALTATGEDAAAVDDTVVRLSNTLSGLPKRQLIRLSMLLVAKAAGYRDAATRGRG